MGIVFFGVRIRGRQRYSYPPPETSFDEIGYVWLGQGWLRRGVLFDWSVFNIYFDNSGKNSRAVGLGDEGLIPQQGSSGKGILYLDKEMEVDGYKSHFRLVQPCLDNPPLAAVLFGGMNLRQPRWSKSVHNSRDVMVWWSIPVILGVLGLGYRLGGRLAGLLGAAIYAVGPGYVISSRMGLPENLLAGLLVWAIWGAWELAGKPKKWLMVGVTAMAVAAPLVKMSGVIVPAVIAVVLFSRKKLKWGWVMLGWGLLGVLLYGVFGAGNNFEVWKRVLIQQGSRGFEGGPVTMLTRMLLPRVPVLMIDGWIILGFMAAAAALIWGKQKYKLVAGMIIIHNVFFGLFGGGNFPWYQFIVYPVLAVMAGVTVGEMIKKPRWEFNGLFFFMVLSPLLYYWKMGAEWKQFIGIYRWMILLAVAGPAGFVLVKKNKLDWLIRAVLIVMVAISMVMSSKVEANLNRTWTALNQANLRLW